MQVPTKTKVRLSTACFVVVAWIALTLPGSAQTALPVFVNFQFRNSVRNPVIVASEPDISKELAKTMGDEFRFWDFRAGKTEDFPRLDVWLERGSGWDIRMEFLADASTPAKPDQPWQSVLFETGETDRRFNGGLPPGKQFIDEINKAFKSRMIGAQREAIATILQKLAPLGNAVIMGPSEFTRAVLPLNWESYSALGQSRFRIILFKTGGANDVIILFSDGTGHAEPFPGAEPSWNAIAVKHVEYAGGRPISDPGELRQLQPRVFYLDRVVDVVPVGNDVVVPIP